ncbi:MAG: aspartate carbamoyltransferase [Candidatus Dormibacteraeota bacterium]|nr:aspartate carbamoyltransferase [Candidatus Dormibacteraeota bacterium]MBV9526097.1 aspartate carbamoyltransferase [Candidatus Dormibacteraeota bacterium]
MTVTAVGRRVLEHVISSEQFGRELLDSLFARAADLQDVRDERLKGRIMATLFYEPSTRTRLSFESAMLRLGGSVLGTEAARTFSSAIKGETLEDTIRMVSTYADVIVLRHDEMGAAARAARVASVPVINAGDGPGEHPTQALLDLFTIERELGRVDGVRVALCGDLRFGRTARSLALLLSLYPDVRLVFVAPDVVQVGGDILARLDERGIRYTLASQLDDVVSQVDVVYQTRVQKERFTDPHEFEQARSAIRIDATVMRRLDPRAIVMHPLPRVDELATEVDSDPRAAYFRQAANGVAIRMALLELLLA